MSELDPTTPVMPDGRSVNDFWRDAGQLFSMFAGDDRYAAQPAAAVLGTVIPALSLGQFAIARGPAKIPGTDLTLQSPRAGLLWARVSPEVDVRLRQATTIPTLRADEWASGPHHWLIHMLGDLNEASHLLQKLREERLGNAPISALLIGPTGGVKIHDFR